MEILKPTKFPEGITHSYINNYDYVTFKVNDWKYTLPTEYVLKILEQYVPKAEIK